MKLRYIFLTAIAIISFIVGCMTLSGSIKSLNDFYWTALVLALGLAVITGILILALILQWFLYKSDSLSKYAFALFVITLILFFIGSNAKMDRLW